MVYTNMKVKEFLKTLKKGTQIKIGTWCSEVKFALEHAPIQKLESMMYAWNYQGEDSIGRSYFTIYV
nr:MAG TPA: hypothetical protein [Caudoviricetes sp.]